MDVGCVYGTSHIQLVWRGGCLAETNEGVVSDTDTSHVAPLGAHKYATVLPKFGGVYDAVDVEPVARDPCPDAHFATLISDPSPEGSPLRFDQRSASLVDLIGIEDALDVQLVIGGPRPSEAADA